MTLTPSTNLIDETEAAKILCVAPGTLRQWRHHKRYPLPYRKIGRLVKYDRAEVEAFIASGRQSGQVPVDD